MTSGFKGLPAFLLRRVVVLCLFVPALQADDLVGPEAAPEAKKEEPAAEVPASVQVFGKVVDDATGEPIEAFLTQAGHFDPKDPATVTWGYSETRNSSSNSFQAQVRWKEGWTARIVADGYVPQPVLAEAPEKERIEKVIRLKRGRVVRGRVLDHLGKPVKGASVFAARPHGMTLAGGQVVNSWDGQEDKSVRGVKTDAEGRFELPLTVAPEPAKPEAEAGEVDSASKTRTPAFAVSTPTFDAWPVPMPEGNVEAVVRLPAPTRVDIQFDIEGSDEEATVFLQSVMHEIPGWKGFEIIRNIKVKNKGHIEITSLPPGRYQFARSRMLHHGNIGQGSFLDRQFINLTEGESTDVSFVRATGARVSGAVSWDEEIKLTGVILSVRKVVPADAPESERIFPPVLDSRLLRAATTDTNESDKSKEVEIVGNRGLFLTERIPPGTYELHAQGYAPLTQDQLRRTGLIGPTVSAQVTITIPETGTVPSVKLKLEKPGGNKVKE